MKKFLYTFILALLVNMAFSQSQCQALFTYSTDSSMLYLFDQSYNVDSTQINITSWTWTVQYGGSSNNYSGPNPSFLIQPAFSGPILVCLHIVTQDSCFSYYCDTVQWSGGTSGCQAYFQYINNSFLTYHFSDNSTAGTPPAAITSWYWAITDNLSNLIFTTNLQNFIFTFPANGIYHICLTIATDSGCSSTWCQYMHVNDSTQGNCALTLSPVIGHVTTIGGNDGYIDLTVTGGSSPYTFYWNTGAITEDIYGLTSGIYTVNIHQSDSLCPVYSASFQVLEPYNNNPLDSLYSPILDTCLNFIPDSFFVNIDTVYQDTVVVTWTFMGQGMTGNITVTYVFGNYGTYLIVVTVNCDTNKMLTSYMTYINITSTFGMDELSSEDLIVYPNPADGNFIIEVPESDPEIQIFNQLGQLYYSNQRVPGSVSINAGDWPAGVYVIRLIAGQQVVTKKLMVR